MEEVLIEDWSLVYKSNLDEYKAPEQRTVHIGGKVYGHLRHYNGKSVLTSSVISTNGREVNTRNTKYKLGKADLNYKEWHLKTYGKELNEDNPFEN